MFADVSIAVVEALDAICKEHELMEAVIRAGNVLCLLLLGIIRSDREDANIAQAPLPKIDCGQLYTSCRSRR